MPALTFYFTNSIGNPGGIFQLISETDPNTGTYASPVTGWIVSTGTTNRSEFRSQTERAATTFDATTYPDGTPDGTNGDGWRTTNAYTGDFVSGTWTVTANIRANTNGGTQDGNMYFRVFRSVNQDGSSATELTTAAISNTFTDLLTTATQSVAATFNPGAVTLAGEYLFVQVACGRTGAGGMTTSDVDFYIGSALAVLVTPSFTSTAAGAFGMMME